MELTRYIDGYCERTGFTYWAEPVNAATNAAFLIAAVIMWQRTAGLPLARALCVVLGAIGVGSYLFHTHAQVWSAIADTTPIAAFILLYLFAANREFWNLSLWPALGLTTMFIPYVLVSYPVLDALPFFTVSAGYWPVPILIAAYAVLLRKRAPETARGLALGSGILIVSLTFRTLDMPVCGSFPVGTHFLWHILNGIMLGWMIEVYRRHQAGVATARPA